MATEAATQPVPAAQVVGNAFVEQYYQILHKSPESVHRFYQDSSVISRPEPNGLVTTVTTMQGINDKICSFDYKKYTAEIKTADAQVSHKNGVIVLVTGSLTGPDNVRKNFTQMFFLAPQDKGYFVLNDVFRYVEDSIVPFENNKVTINEALDSAFAPPPPEPEPAQVAASPTVDSSTSHVEEVQNVEPRVHDQLANKKELVSEKDAVAASEPHSNKNHVSEVTEIAIPILQEDAPKKSYASILSSQTKKGVVGTTKVYVPTKTANIPPKKVENKVLESIANAENSVPSDSANASVVENGKDQEAEGYSIYVRNLPLHVLASEVEEEFKKFGPIKQEGVQVRNDRIRSSCFGFVEFESLSSMTDAIKASPVPFRGRKAVVEIKRTTTRVGSGEGRFSSGRGGFRNNSFRGRENYASSRGYGRNEFTNRGDFVGRGRGPGGRGGQVYQQGRGQGGRQGGSNRIADSA